MHPQNYGQNECVCMYQCGGSVFTVRSREHLAGRQPCKAPGHHMENTLQGKHTLHKSTYIEYTEKTHISIRIKTQLLLTLIQQQTNCEFSFIVFVIAV